MRNYLRGELRRRFDRAWRVLPRTAHASLRPYIIEVAEFGEGSFSPPPEYWVEGGFCYPGNEQECAFIYFHPMLAEVAESQAVATILHELAHALAFQQYAYVAITTAEFNTESAAWHQVAAWLVMKAGSPHLREQHRMLLLGGFYYARLKLAGSVPLQR